MCKFVTINEEAVRENVVNWSDKDIKVAIADRSRVAFVSTDKISSGMNKDIVKVLEMVLIEREKEREKERKKPKQVVFETTYNKLKVTHSKEDDEIWLEYNNSLIVASVDETKNKLETILKSINESI